MGQICFFRGEIIPIFICRYMAPIQGVVSMDGTTVSPAPIQVFNPLILLGFFTGLLNSVFGETDSSSSSSFAALFFPATAKKMCYSLLHC